MIKVVKETVAEREEIEKENLLLTYLICMNEFCMVVVPILKKMDKVGIPLPFPLYGEMVEVIIKKWDDDGCTYGDKPAGNPLFAWYQKELKRNPNAPHLKNIGNFLRRLSDESVMKNYNFDPAYVKTYTKEAEDYLRKHFRRHTLQKAADFNNKDLPEQADRVMDNYSKQSTIFSGQIDIKEALRASGQTIPAFLRDKTIMKPKTLVRSWFEEKGLYLVFAETGVGKTYYCMYWAEMLAYGVPGDTKFGIWTLEDNCDVVLVDAEMSQSQMQKRFGEIGMAHDSSKHQVTLISGEKFTNLTGRNLNFNDPHCRDAFSDHLMEDLPTAKVVILDNLTTLFPGRDLAKQSEWDDANQWLIQLRHLGRTVMVIDHPGKDVKRGPKDTSGKVLQMDAVLGLLKPPGWSPDKGVHFRAVWYKPPRNVGPGPERSAFNIHLKEVEGGHLRWFLGLPIQGDRDMEILRMLGTSKLSYSEIAKQVERAFPEERGHTATWVGQIFQKGVENKWITENKILTEEGRLIIGEENGDER